MFTKSFQTRLDEAAKVFVCALDKLKSVQSDLTAQIADNDSQIQKLSQENSDLESMKAKTEKQIGEISKFIG